MFTSAASTLGRPAHQSGGHFFLFALHCLICIRFCVDILDREEQAYVFVEHFFDQQNLPGIPYDLSISNDLRNDLFCLVELDAAINKTINFTPGEDDITAQGLKAINNHNKIKYFGILNHMFQSGTVSGGWMSATILPIWKRGRPNVAIGSY